MLGTFQQSQLRIEIEATGKAIGDSLLTTRHLKEWLRPQTFSPDLPARLQTGSSFTSWSGPIPVDHRAIVVGDNHLRLILSRGIDGYHEWYWGDGWVQSRLEGISILPLNLGQTLTLVRLRQYLSRSTNLAS